jgi:hypothetical protein
MDVYTTTHKKNFFVNKKYYDFLCFTCFFVPKIEFQKYNKDGTIAEEVQLSYSCENLCEPEELYKQGTAETLKQARISVESVKRVCKGINSSKKDIFRPKPVWNID